MSYEEETWRHVTRDIRKAYEEEDTCMSHESVSALVTRDTRKSYTEEDTCISYESAGGK
jgi:hypothetical protein